MGIGMTVACVVVLHALVLWALQGALRWPLLRPMAVVLPMQVKLIVLPPLPPAAPPPAPQSAPKPPISQPAKPLKPLVAQRAPPPAPRAVLQTAPQAAPPQAEQQSAPEAPSAPMGEPAAAPSGAPAGPPASAVAAAPAAVPPSSEAQCPGNPEPPYPPMSKRLGETGRVIVGALIGADGRVQEVNLQRSSGYSRLDEAAKQAVRHWRCQPVTRDGVPQTEWRNAPVDFILRS